SHNFEFQERRGRLHARLQAEGRLLEGGRWRGDREIAMQGRNQPGPWPPETDFWAELGARRHSGSQGGHRFSV
ncbi:MAG: hypothetical protein LBQ12_00745, partial [Deltaproteobacteria bacterium]|nr:hypothetical protein [Deltaproteobacteria bacterium]